MLKVNAGVRGALEALVAQQATWKRARSISDFLELCEAWSVPGKPLAYTYSFAP